MVSPLSTMMVEAAIFGRRVIVIAYDDGTETLLRLPDLFKFEIFEGIERIEGSRVAHQPDDLGRHFADFVNGSPPTAEAMRRGPLGWWLHFDDRT